MKLILKNKLLNNIRFNIKFILNYIKLTNIMLLEPILELIGYIIMISNYCWIDYLQLPNEVFEIC